MKSFQLLFLIFAALCMASMVNAEGHLSNETMSDTGMDEMDEMDVMMGMHNDTNTTDREVVSAAGKLGAMVSMVAVVVGSFAL